MARYKYLGEPPRPGMTYGATTKIGVPTKMEGLKIYLPVAPKTEFVIGEDLGYDFADQFSIVALDANTVSFQRIA